MVYTKRFQKDMQAEMKKMRKFSAWTRDPQGVIIIAKLVKLISDAIARFSNQLSHAVFRSQQLVCLKIQESKLHPLMQKEFFCGITENNETRMLTCKQLEVTNLSKSTLWNYFKTPYLTLLFHIDRTWRRSATVDSPRTIHGGPTVAKIRSICCLLESCEFAKASHWNNLLLKKILKASNVTRLVNSEGYGLLMLNGRKLILFYLGYQSSKYQTNVWGWTQILYDYWWTLCSHQAGHAQYQPHKGRMRSSVTWTRRSQESNIPGFVK